MEQPQPYPPPQTPPEQQAAPPPQPEPQPAPVPQGKTDDDPLTLEEIVDAGKDAVGQVTNAIKKPARRVARTYGAAISSGWRRFVDGMEGKSEPKDGD
jgi:hypothetical protein